MGRGQEGDILPGNEDDFRGGRPFDSLRSLRAFSRVYRENGADQDRTGNPHVANVVLSQLSYGPDIWCKAYRTPMINSMVS
jgi:hypothetical protein